MKKSGIGSEQRFDFADNHGQNILPKARKLSNIGQYQNTLISSLAYVLTSIVKNWFLKEKLDTSLYLHQSSILFSFPNFLNSFRNLWGNSNTEIIVLNAQYHFTCGRLIFHRKTLNCKYVKTSIIWRFFMSNNDSSSWKHQYFG